MSESPGYRSEPFGLTRRLVAASVGVSREWNTIHLVTEMDITGVRHLMAAHKEEGGEGWSLTAYVVACLARVCAEFPRFNAFRKGRRLILLDDLTISVLVEREIEDERVPEPVGIRQADRKTFREINTELHEAQRRAVSRVGESSGMGWVRFIPGFLLRSFVRWASRHIGLQQRFGRIAVTAVGMFGPSPMWAIPLSSATVLATVGSIVSRPALVDGALEEREYLCMTLSFDHDIVDGAPAARFAKRLAEVLAGAGELRNMSGD